MPHSSSSSSSSSSSRRSKKCPPSTSTTLIAFLFLIILSASCTQKVVLGHDVVDLQHHTTTSTHVHHLNRQQHRQSSGAVGVGSTSSLSLAFVPYLKQQQQQQQQQLQIIRQPLLTAGRSLSFPCNYNIRHTRTSNWLCTTSTNNRFFLLLHAKKDDDNAADNNNNKNNNNNSSTPKQRNKRIVVIRHGCTYMNEYLSKPGCRWGDANFTDIFPKQKQTNNNNNNNKEGNNDDCLYLDTPLSERGIRQAQRLSRRVSSLLEGGGGRPGADVDASLKIKDQNVMREIDLIAVSPLTRALQTMELGLLTHLRVQQQQQQQQQPEIGEERNQIPIVALPLASERLYLISDVGKPASQLAKQFPYVDFESEFSKDGQKTDSPWWYRWDDDSKTNYDDITSSSSSSSSWPAEYVEWRPTGQGQTYACPGEPDKEFHHRMMALYDWLDSREESTIALICHWGVIQWLIGADFENCEMRVVPFDEFKRTGFMLSDEEEAEIFALGEKNIDAA